MKRRGRPPHPDILTPREWEVLEFLRQGLSNPDIAQRLGISREGVKYHVSEILSKLGVSSREEAALWQPRPPSNWAPLLAPAILLWRGVRRAMPVQASHVALAISALLLTAALTGLGLIAFLLLRADGEDAALTFTETPGPADLRTCQAKDVRAVARYQPAAGSTVGGLYFSNQSSTACALRGRPYVAALDGLVYSEPAATDVTHPRFGTSGEKVGLEPGERAVARLEWGQWCGPVAEEPIVFRVELPDGAGQLAAPLLGGTGLPSYQTAGCHGRRKEASQIQPQKSLGVGTFEPGDSDAWPPEALFRLEPEGT